LVERRRSCHDRRRHTVTLTDAGRQRYEDAVSSITGVEDELLAGLSTDQRTALHELLRSLQVSNLQPASEDC